MPFFPRQAIRDATASLLLLVTLFALAFLVGAPIFSKADPSSLDFVPRAQWFFMPLQRFADFMPGPLLTPFATWIFLIVLFVAMASVPFLDRDAERNPFRRPAMTILGIFIILLFGMLFILEVMQDPAINDNPTRLRSKVTADGGAVTGLLGPATVSAKAADCESWETHILLATLLLGTATIAPSRSCLAWRTNSHITKNLPKISLVNVVIYSIGAVLAISPSSLRSVSF